MRDVLDYRARFAQKTSSEPSVETGRKETQMRLLTRSAILSAMAGPRQRELDIGGFDEKLLHSTFYYFRLGHRYRVPSESWSQSTNRLSSDAPELTIPAMSGVVVKSLERFVMSDRILSLFGQISEFSERGLQLSHSPFIDPGFEGHLDLGIYNLTGATEVLKLGERIGKVIFLEVDGVDDSLSSTSGKLRARREFEDNDPVPPYDGIEPYDYDWRKR